METDKEILENRSRIALLDVQLNALIDILAQEGIVSHREVEHRVTERLRTQEKLPPAERENGS